MLLARSGRKLNNITGRFGLEVSQERGKNKSRILEYFKLKIQQDEKIVR